MKRGIFVYQASPVLGRSVRVSEGAFAKHTFMGFGKGRRFLERL